MSKRTKIKPQLKRATSLIETILYIALVSILMLTVTSYWSTLIQANSKTQESIKYSTEADFLLATISSYIRSATAINTPTAGSSATTINLTMADSAVNPTIISFVGNNVNVKRGAGADTAIQASNVTISNLSFANLSSPSTSGNIRISLTLGNNQTYYTSATIR